MNLKTLKTLPDTRLVALARAGDSDAFGELVRRYRPLARRLVGDAIEGEETARELVQEALLQAFLSLGRLRSDEHFPGWLAGIARNVCRDHRRRKAGDPLAEAPSLYWAFETAIAPAAHEPFAAAAAREREQAVWAAIQGLSPKNREAVVLFYYERCGLKEIAEALEVSVGAVKGRLDKARRALRARLGDLLGDTVPFGDRVSATGTGESITPDITSVLLGQAPRQTRTRGTRKQEMTEMTDRTEGLIEVSLMWISHFGDDPLEREPPLTSERHARRFVLATLVSPSPGYSRDHVLLIDEARKRTVPLAVGGPAVTEAIVQGRSAAESGEAREPLPASGPAGGEDASRPLAYDLMHRLLDAVEVLVESVCIDVAEDIHFATIALRRRRSGLEGTLDPIGEAGKEAILAVRARPGDALALAAQAGCAVYAAEAVFGAADVWDLSDAPDIARRLWGEGTREMATVLTVSTMSTVTNVADAGTAEEEEASPASLRGATIEPLIVRVSEGIVDQAIRFLRRRSEAQEVQVVLERRPGNRGHVLMQHQAGSGGRTANVPMPPAVLPVVIAHFKVLTGLDLSVTGRPQAGQTSVLHEGREYDLFVKTTAAADPTTLTMVAEGKKEGMEATSTGERLTLRLRARAVGPAVGSRTSRNAVTDAFTTVSAVESVR